MRPLAPQLLENSTIADYHWKWAAFSMMGIGNQACAVCGAVLRADEPRRYTRVRASHTRREFYILVHPYHARRSPLRFRNDGSPQDGLCRSANHPDMVVPLTQPTRREGRYCVVCWATGSRPQLATIYTTCRSSLHPGEAVVCVDDGREVACPRCILVAEATRFGGDRVTPPAPSKEELAWVIEAGSAPWYFSAEVNSCGPWTTDHKKAVRFARREDAESILRFIDFLPRAWAGKPDQIRVVEHAWIDVRERGQRRVRRDPMLVRDVAQSLFSGPFPRGGV